MMSSMKCPKCGSRATKIINLSTGKIECQKCGEKYSLPEEPK
jgi:transposase